MLIYLASRYSRHIELQCYRDELERLGHTVTSRWIDGDHKIGPSGSQQADDAERTRFAQEDWVDMMKSDCVVSFTEEPRQTKTRGGRHVEFGGALAMQKECVVIGWQENVFHHLPEVAFYATWGEYLEHMEQQSEAA